MIAQNNDTSGADRVLRKTTLAGLAALAVLAGMAPGMAQSQSATIKIGVPVPLSGSSANAGTDIVNGAKLAATKINAAGGVLGKQIEIVPEDDACDAQTAVQAAQKLVDAGVVAVAGGYCSSAALPELTTFHRAGIPYVLDASTNPKLTEMGYDNVFRTIGRDDEQGPFAASFMKNSLHAKRAAVIDFSGTSAQQPDNFNAPRAVCLAAVLYVFRTLIDRPIPLNEGCLEPLEVIIPSGSMLDPAPPAAVAAGNVETSQCIVDALYGALGVLAASQGTMNNLTFGDNCLQYYETIAGGAGADPDFDGCDAVQTHMTNSRLTDPEILESKFPVLVREFSVRRGSGGQGLNRGGDGTVRRLEFRAPMSGALLANHRRVAPFGLQGGSAGAVGTGSIRRATGEIEHLGATARFDVAPGDELTSETPGGGGYGPLK